MVEFVKSKVELLQHCGDDHYIANVARVSNHKWQDSNENDERIIKFLSQCEFFKLPVDKFRIHFSPFCHTFMSFRIKAPIIVARQLMRSTVGLIINEVSRRYVTNDPEFYDIEYFRKTAPNVKQGSIDTPTENNEYWLLRYQRYLQEGLELYTEMMKEGGICPEQARMVIPPASMTEWIWSGSMFAFVRVCALRCDPHAQKESKEIANEIYKHLKEKFPLSTKYVLKGIEENE
jgi:thymidylate synthase (FAD)